MKRPLIELNYVYSKIAPGAPMVYSGDIFDDGWREQKIPPELINLVLEYLPPGYGIPGQHDLPHHRLEDIKKSAFWTLVKAGKITYLDPKVVHIHEPTNKLALIGFPWGKEVRPLTHPDGQIFKGKIKLAVIHDYCWMGDHSFPGAPEEKNVSHWNAILEGYDVAVFGDNHKGFTYYNHSLKRYASFRNGGTFMIRKADEIDYKPTIGLLTNRKRWINYNLDVSQDVYNVEHLVDTKEGEDIDVEEVKKAIEGLGDAAVDFVAVMQQVANKQKLPIREIITRGMASRNK